MNSEKTNTNRSVILCIDFITKKATSLKVLFDWKSFCNTKNSVIHSLSMKCLFDGYLTGGNNYELKISEQPEDN